MQIEPRPKRPKSKTLSTLGSKRASLRNQHRLRVGGEPCQRRAHDFDDRQQQEDENARCRQRLVFTVAVGVILVGRLLRGARADQAEDIGRGVGERVEAVGDDADCPGGVPKHQLRPGDRQVEEENAKKDPRNRGVAIQNVRASGSGHHRSWTRPMMYFFGTNLQWRLSELLLR